MTTHEGHDHPNTKAGRAACRRAALQGQPPKTRLERSKADHPAGKKAKKAAKVDPALPHEFNPLIGKPTQCYDCGRAKRATVHKQDQGTGFVFDKSGKLVGLRLW